MNTLLHTLQSLQNALAMGQPIDHLGVRIYDGRIVTVPTPRGPASFHLRDLSIIVRAGLDKSRPPASPPAPAAIPTPRPTPVPFPLEKTFAWGEFWPKKFRPGVAPKRAVGNFSTEEQARATVAAMQHNLNEAAKSGNVKLAQVMRDALAVARDRAGME